MEKDYIIIIKELLLLLQVPWGVSSVHGFKGVRFFSVVLLVLSKLNGINAPLSITMYVCLSVHVYVKQVLIWIDMAEKYLSKVSRIDISKIRIEFHQVQQCF
jgi:hypothetical protein